ncbi:MULTISPECIES: TonB-dependent receptor [unclassified Acinetobacter]|uniref:TonB-dependent receptor n=1 Tax=unclassified Acinetobacter TaxID=196816 RepID=UPI0035BAA3FB
MQKKYFFPTLSVLSLLVTQQSYAQDMQSNMPESEPSANLSSLTLSADKTGMVLANRIHEMPGITKVISEEQIARQATGSRQLADVIAQLVPSLGASSGTTSNYGQTMRGRQVQYLLNGVPLTGSRDISRQLNSINPQQVARIEVLSGATSIYGAGATGGLINIVTKSDVDAEHAFQTRVGLNTANFKNESFGYQIGQTFTAHNQQGNVQARLDVDYAKTGGMFDSKGKRIAPEPAQTDKQDSTNLSVNASLGWKIDDKQNLSTAITHYQDQQNTDFAPDYGPRLAVLFGAKPSLQAIKGLSLAEQPKTTKNSFNMNYHHDDIFGQALNATAYYRQETGRFYPFAVPFSVNNALPLLQGMNLTPAQLATQAKALQSSAFGVLQSESKVDVFGARLALQRALQLQNKPLLLTYGVDFEREKDSQHAQGYDLQKFMQSNGLQFVSNQQNYTYGPNTTINSLGVFVDANMRLSDAWKVNAGVRHQRIDSDTDSFIPPSEKLLANLLAQKGLRYTAKDVAAGKVSHQKTLFNLGTNYAINANHNIFANFSQGYSLPDLQRVLRDVSAGFVVNSHNVEPISVNSYDLGWSGKFGNTRAKVTGFYNTSDKVTQFLKDFSVTVADTDERIYGAELELNHRINPEWALGGSLAYTRGQYKDAQGNFKALGAFRVSPLKATAFAEYTSPEQHKLRLQVLAIDGTDQAYQDSLTAASNQNVRKTPEAKIKGYAVIDLLGEFQLPQGRLNFGVYNLANSKYKSVFSQAAATTYGEMSSLVAPGRNFALRYSIDY